MAAMSRSFAVLKNMLKDIEKILHITIIIVQSIFFITYGYSIYCNLDNILFLIIYIILFALSLFYFIFYLKTYKKGSKLIDRIKRFSRIFKYLVNGTMVVVKCVEMVEFGISDFNKILLIVSAVSLLAQVVIEFIRIFTEKYIDLFTEAVKMDLAWVGKLGKVKEVKGNLFELIDAPLEALANKIEGTTPSEPELTEIQKKLNKMAEDYEVEVKETKKEKKEKKKEEIRRKSKENADKQKQEIKEHLNVIKKKVFKKN